MLLLLLQLVAVPLPRVLMLLLLLLLLQLLPLLPLRLCPPWPPRVPLPQPSPEPPLHGRVAVLTASLSLATPTVLAPLPTMSMFGNYNLEVYPPCEEPLVVTNVFEAQNGSRALFLVNHDASTTVHYEASAEGPGHAAVHVHATIPPLSARALALEPPGPHT